MPLLYSVKIKYKDGLIVGLVSSQLRMDFIAKYIDFTSEFSSVNYKLPPEQLKIENLQIVMEDYVRWVQDNNYILRLPNQLQMESAQQDEQWINVQLNIPIKKGLFEQSGQIAGISLFIGTFVLNEFFFTLAARLNKVSYTTLILPILADFTMAGIVYTFSGAISNIVDQGKELDDLLYRKEVSPMENIALEKGYLFCSSWNLARFILCVLPIANTIFSSFTYWQGVMAMRDKFEASNANDPIITSKFIYNLAITNTVIGAIYGWIELTSFSLKATNVLKGLIDNFYNVCGARSIRGERYSEVLTEEEQTESEIDDIYSSPVATITSSFNIIKPSNRKVNSDEKETTMFFITGVVYNNLLLNEQGLLFETAQIGGAEAVQNIINLGEDYEVASTIIKYIRQYGSKHVVKILFGDAIKNYKVDIESSCNQIVAIAEDEAAKKYSETFILSDVKKIAGKIIEQNFFLNNDKGRDFIKVVANIFDKEALLKILELGREQDIAEQIMFESEIQGVDKIISILLGEKTLVAGYTDNLEIIIGQQELSQLRLIPNGIFHAWSNKAYHKIVEYIDNLAKSLDDLLNMGKSVNQVAITIVMLEELLGFVASGQRFIGDRPPYYNPYNNDDWPLGGSESSNEKNNSLAGNFDSQNEFTGLVLPSYNGTDYDINHQM